MDALILVVFIQYRTNHRGHLPASVIGAEFHFFLFSEAFLALSVGLCQVRFSQFYLPVVV